MYKGTKATRDGFGDAILKLGKKKSIITLTADLMSSVKLTAFKDKYPKQFFECGVAEQNMVAISTGLALSNKIPFATTFGVFFTRALDQIRVSVCYNKANVKLIATHCGLITGPDGATHQALEDIAIMRSLPNMTVVVPADYQEAIKATKAIAQYNGPCYLRLGREKVPDITNKNSKFQIGKINILKRGKDITLIGTGSTVYLCLEAAKQLKEKRNINAEVINCHTIKPIDKKGILASYKKTKNIITIEDHQISGGLGSAVAELGIPVKIIGVKDTFAESGNAEELYEKYGITVKEILKRV